MYNDYYNYFREIQLQIPHIAQKNGTIFIHNILVPTKSNLKEIYFQNLINVRDSVYVKAKLTKYAVPLSATFNLLKDKTVMSELMKPVTHLRSRYGITMCTEHLNLPHENIPMEMIPLMRINTRHEFLPIVEPDILNMRLKDLVEITSETTHMNLTYFYNPSSFGKMRFMLQIKATLHQFLSLGFTEKDIDEVKGVFADTNLYLLCATFFIGSVHVRFKNTLICYIIIKFSAFIRFSLFQKRCYILEVANINGRFVNKNCDMESFLTNNSIFIFIG